MKLSAMVLFILRFEYLKKKTSEINWRERERERERDLSNSTRQINRPASWTVVIMASASSKASGESAHKHSLPDSLLLWGGGACTMFGQ